MVILFKKPRRIFELKNEKQNLSSFQTENEMDKRHPDPDGHCYALPGLNDIGC